jgi:hypothetical protein
MHCTCAHGQVAGQGFYVISVNYLRYFVDYLRYSRKKTEPQFMSCVPRGRLVVGPGV